MDELKKLKEILDKSLEKKISQPIDCTKIESIIRKKSTGPIAKIKRNIQIEIWVGIISILLLSSVMTQFTGPYFTVKLGILICIIIAFIVYYYYNLREIKKIWHYNQQNVIRSIESTVALLRFYRRFYFLLNMALFPFVVYLAFIIGFGLGSQGQRMSTIPFIGINSVLLSLIIYFILFCIFYWLFWLFLKLYVNKLYDDHINKLSDILDELLENENQLN